MRVITRELSPKTPIYCATFLTLTLIASRHQSPIEVESLWPQCFCWALLEVSRYDMLWLFTDTHWYATTYPGRFPYHTLFCITNFA